MPVTLFGSNSPIVNGEGLTYYEWLCAAGARGRCSDNFLRFWMDGVDPTEIKAEFLRELYGVSETKEQIDAHSQLNADHRET
jgi:hypothetical protein